MRPIYTYTCGYTYTYIAVYAIYIHTIVCSAVCRCITRAFDRGVATPFALVPARGSCDSLPGVVAPLQCSGNYECECGRSIITSIDNKLTPRASFSGALRPPVRHLYICKSLSLSSFFLFIC